MAQLDPSRNRVLHYFLRCVGRPLGTSKHRLVLVRGRLVLHELVRLAHWLRCLGHFHFAPRVLVRRDERSLSDLAAYGPLGFKLVNHHVECRLLAGFQILDQLTDKVNHVDVDILTLRWMHLEFRKTESSRKVFQQHVFLVECFDHGRRVLLPRDGSEHGADRSEHLRVGLVLVEVREQLETERLDLSEGVVDQLEV